MRPLLLASSAVVRGIVGRSRFAAAAAVASLGTACVGGSISMLESAPRPAGKLPSPFVRVVSYNVLSSHLCEPSHFVACKPEDLEPAKRLERLKRALHTHCENEAVICLQEVSAQWAGELTPFFEQEGYTFVTGSYGSPFNGYMGVSLAWPKARFESEAVDITRASDIRQWPEPPPPPPSPGVIVRGWRRVKKLWSGPPPKKPFDVQHESKRRHNFIVSAKLRCRRTNEAIAVSTYHMPCLFGSDPKVQVMVVHAALAAQHALAFAAGTPCILAGDFNFGPDSAPYQLVTSGSLPEEHVHYPPQKAGDTWRPAVTKPLVSAYVSAGKPEPDFTNLATTSWQSDPFVGTLDYIFLSSGDWKASSVRSLPTREDVLPVCTSYPNAEEPSDHVAIWADLDLLSMEERGGHAAQAQVGGASAAGAA